jgi:type I restriction enzyme S subunit
MKQFSRVASSNLNSARLDAEYYGTAYVENAKRISSFGSVSTLEEMRKRSAPIRRGIDMPNFVEDEECPLMVTIAAFEDPGINFKRLQRISKSQHQAFKGSHIKAGDLLVAMGGYAGKAAICPPDTPESNIGRHTARIVIDEANADVYYVWAFIRSFVGTLQFDRYITGSVQAGINLEDIRDISIARPSVLAQKYIGDKVRQAERLRDWGKKRYQESIELFKNAVANYGYIPKSSKKFFRAKLESRLDPEYYDTKYSFFYEEWFLSNSHPLQEFIAEGAYGVLPDSNSYGSGEQRFIRATDIRQSNIDSTAFTRVPSEQVAVKAKIKTGDILFEIKGAIEACELAGAHLNGAYVNGSIYRFTPKNIKAGYLAFYLRSFIKQLYCERVSVNNIIAYLDLGSISALPVLRLSAEQEDSIEKAFLGHLECARYAFALTKAAKQLVEALIEDKFIEAEIVAAEKALQAGNELLDRRIFNRLKTDGIDGHGAALFEDPDELYRLLRQAKVD